ncbi:hypothetical protein DN396_00640 [Bacillus sp. BF9-10]|nr:hypothetical protein DN396_00640 [Bacillus sp. BF9-10]
MGDQLSINVRLVQLIISGGMNKTPLIKVSLYKVRGMRDGYILINRHELGGRSTVHKRPIGSTNNQWNKTPLIKVSLYKVRGMRDGYILINRHVTCNCDCYFRGIMVEMACIY